jgi:outer membrane receptor for monomeric catechols
LARYPESRDTEAVIPAGTPASTPVSVITARRSEYQGCCTDNFLQSQTDLTARFATGGVRHVLVNRVEFGSETPNSNHVVNVCVPTTDLAPDYPSYLTT